MLVGWDLGVVDEAVDIRGGGRGVDWRLAESCCWTQSIVVCVLILRRGGLGEGVRRGGKDRQVGRWGGCHGSGRRRRVALMVGGY